MKAPRALLALGLALTPVLALADAPVPVSRDIAFASTAPVPPFLLSDPLVVPETPKELPPEEGEEPAPGTQPGDEEEISPFPPLIPVENGASDGLAPSLEDAGRL